MVGEKDEFTFRKWNPNHLNEGVMTVGNKADNAVEDYSFGGFMCCYICMCVNGWMDTAFEEVIDHAADGSLTAKDYFNSEDIKLVWATRMTRILGLVLAVSGFWMIFTPVIVLLKWIPLIGALLGGIAAFASFLFALLVGLTLSFLVMAAAWLFFRPCLALSLLTLSGIGIYLVFGWDGKIPAL